MSQQLLSPLEQEEDGLPLFWSLKYRNDPKKGKHYWGHAYWRSQSASMNIRDIYQFYLVKHKGMDEPNLWEFMQEFWRVYFHELLHLLFKFRITEVIFKGKKRSVKNHEGVINRLSYHLADWIEIFDKEAYHYFWELFFDEYCTFEHGHWQDPTLKELKS